MNLGELEAAFNLIVQDSSLVSKAKTWINTAILELAADYEMPPLRLLTPTSFPVTATTWLWTLPVNFHKKLFRCAGAEYRRLRIHERIEYLDHLDLDHDATGDLVTDVAVADQGGVNYLGIHPLAAETLYLWYYRKPLILTLPAHVPDLMPPEFHERVILPKAVIKAYEHLQDQVENFDPKPLQYWQKKLADGLHGFTPGSIGLINYFVKLRGGPRRTGGRNPLGGRGY